MSKRKATTDIHPDARDGSPATSRLKIEGTADQITNARKPPGTIATPLFGKDDTESSGSPGVSGDAILVESLAPQLSKDRPLIQPNTSKIAPGRDSHPESGPVTTEISSIDCDPTAMRSQHFLENIAELNRSFANWINICIQNDPTVLLTRVFIDHQRQVQALFDEEKMCTEGFDKLLVLRAQEKVLQLLREADVNVEVVSTRDNDVSLSGDNLEEETPLINGPEATQLPETPSVVPSPNAFILEQTFNPFLNNKAVNGIEPFTLPIQNTDKVKDVINDLKPKSAEAVVEKPINFGAFSFASACSEAAAKAAAAKEQESEEVNDDNPPKVEFTPVQEEGSIFTKRCKIFFKKEKEEGYEDRGIGNLFVKPVTSTNRHQLIVRSETSLGNLLVNVLLSPDIPIKKMGQKDVMLVMVPTPGSGIRVVMMRMKDGVDEVVEMLTKYSTT